MITKKEDGLVMITGQAKVPNGLWIRAKARPRGYVTCAWSSRAIIKGDLVYRPMSNAIGRHYRILATEVERRL